MLRRTRRTVGLTLISFGLGVLLATAFPSWFLVTLMAGSTILVGCCIFKC